MASQTRPEKSSIPLILLLLLLLGAGLLVLPSLNVNVNKGVQSTPEGQCQSGGKSFDELQEAYTLALVAEQYRSANPFRGNYGLGSYTICYKDGTQQRSQSIPFKGYFTYSNPKPHITHSEQATYGWLQSEFSRLAIDRSRVTAIYVVIFSQVVVCPPCKQDMKSWQRTLRQKARTNKLFLSIWDISRETGFVPASYPAGSGTSVTIDDLEEVLIEFDP